ncbi:amidohydrolase [Streptomyces uncialis]|uniref:Amidohydrolase n=1 Tax=Streptomyces uncialis TaxID=1048205 RepID=A0A1Q4V8M1_9ACTN|nr:amidohydrolase [Streptomyces uncialis]OKH94164.1 amidohydrolase [Streptomyces uncialis]
MTDTRTQPPAARGTRSAADRADLVLLGGPVFTADAARSWTDGLAVRAGRIVALGAPAARALTGPRTEIVDLAGRMVVPGFVDGHAHPVFGGLERARCDLPGAVGPAESARLVAEYAARHPGRPWVVGGGWSMDHFPSGTPDRATLDAVVPDRPVFLLNRDRHGAWVNTRALELAGIDRRTPDPADGRIERASDGTPTGTLHEGAADLVARHLPPITAQEYEQALLEGQRHLHSLGVTGWQDALIGAYLSYPDPLAAYLSLAGSGRLTGRVTGALWWDRERGVEQLAELVERRERGHVGRFRATTVKVMQDGVCENFTAALLTPYLPAPDAAHGPGSGHSYLAPAELDRAVTALDGAGFQVHFHTIGDRAVREALNAVEAAMTARHQGTPAIATGPHTPGPHGPRTHGADPHSVGTHDSRTHNAGHHGDNRHHLAHVQLVHPDDVPRFRRLGTAANMQPLWAVHDEQMAELTVPFLGAERAARQYVFGALRAAGTTLVAGSDWPVSSADPLAGIHVAVNRTTPGTDIERPFLPEQRLDLADALCAYTAAGAWINHRDRTTGTLAPGMYADLAVLDRDPFEGPVNRIADTRVDLTLIEGVPVHQRDGAP